MTTPIERHLQEHGIFTNPPPPPDAPTLTLTVRDPEGFGCQAGKGQVYLLIMLTFMDCSVWATCPGVGSVQVTEGGEITPAFSSLGARIGFGEDILFSATGPEAQHALNACRAMVEGTPQERKAMFRRSHHQLKAAKPSGKGR